MPRIKSWMVTGASGFLGQAVVRRLVARGDKVRGFDIEPCPPALAALRGYEHVVGDIRDPAAVAAACRGVTGVLHGAAALPILRDAKLIHAINADGTRNVLAGAEAAGCKSVLFVSTTAVYGLHKVHPIHEGIPLVPIGPYGESKIAAERLCEAYRDRMHVPIIRPKTFLGEGRLGVFEILFDWIHDGKRIPLIGPGHNKYQLLHVEDLIDAMLLASEDARGNATFNVACREFGSLREDLSPLFEAAGHPPSFFPLPKRTTIAGLWVLDKLRLSPLTQWHYGTMASDSYVETDRIRDTLGWTPKRTNKQVLLDSYVWYHAHHDEVKGSSGTTHTVPWNQKALGWFKRFF